MFHSRSNKYLVVALLFALMLHGTTMFFTLEGTYDALIHVFFSEHYASDWFSTWNAKWYTGFTVLGYPPLVHQSMALLSLAGGLKFGLFAFGFLVIVLFISGVYRFSKMISGNEHIAGFAAVLAVFSTSFIEAFHVFGQLPSLTGISLLLHTLPEIYAWIRRGKPVQLVKALVFTAVTVASHHVTPIFGMVFFVFPTIGLALIDGDNTPVSGFGIYKKLLAEVWQHRKRILMLGAGMGLVMVFTILPYWLNSFKNPITQVSIPHGSRDDFFEVFSSGLVFFLIPWGILLFVLPFILKRLYTPRMLFFGLSFTLLLILGTGDTTPIPQMILGKNAFNILTLDRFTFWGSIMALPSFAELVYRFSLGDIKTSWQQKIGEQGFRVLAACFAGLGLTFAVFTVVVGQFRPHQPKPVDMLPIVNFLNADKHDQWRYLPLGFGDQMAWLAAQTDALTVDGNYHSARRLPELTTKAVERLENAKYRGKEGLASLSSFLTDPEKFHLKYVLSNDKFYDPLLYFTGWQKLSPLENGVEIWERSGITPLPKINSKEEVDLWLRLLWALLPLSVAVLALVLSIIETLLYRKKRNNSKALQGASSFVSLYKRSTVFLSIWAATALVLLLVGCIRFTQDANSHFSPENLVRDYYDALDFKQFKKAHQLLNPQANIGIDQFMLEVSVTDGLLSSYAKLANLDIKVLWENRTFAKVATVAEWVTPLKNLIEDRVHHLKRVNGKWYLMPDPVDADIPVNQVTFSYDNYFFNHGRRRVTTQETHHEDVLRQPAIALINSSVVMSDSTLSVVGAVQNVDYFPADIGIAVNLYSNNKRVATAQAKDCMKHQLLAKEITGFRVDFDTLSWMSASTNSFHSLAVNALLNQIDFCEISISSNVLKGRKYTSTVLRNVAIENRILHGDIYNYGTQEITVPQLLISFYDSSKNPLWQEAVYLPEAIRIQKHQSFEVPLKTLFSTTRKEMAQTSILNGVEEEQVTQKFLPQRKRTYDADYIPYQGGYVTVSVNPYIGNYK